MVLFAKEVVTCDRVMATIERFDHSTEPTSISPLPQDHLQSIFLWLNYANSALKKRLDSDGVSIFITHPNFVNFFIKITFLGDEKTIIEFAIR